MDGTSPASLEEALKGAPPAWTPVKPEPAKIPGKHWSAFAVLLFGMFMAILDIQIV